MDFRHCHRYLTMALFATQNKGCQNRSMVCLDDEYNRIDISISWIPNLQLHWDSIWIQAPRKPDGLVHDYHRDY